MAGLAILVLAVFATVAVLLVTPRDADDGIDDLRKRSGRRHPGTARDGALGGALGGAAGRNTPRQFPDEDGRMRNP